VRRFSHNASGTTPSPWNFVPYDASVETHVLKELSLGLRV
jgi:hypothetical protein